MNLERIKELEDIKKKIFENREIYNNLVKEKNNKYYEDAKEDFKKIFKEKGFEINEQQEEVEVIYGETNIKLSKEISEDNHLHLKLVFSIKSLIIKYNNEYKILLGRLNNSLPIKMLDDNKYIIKVMEITEEILENSIKNETRKLEEFKQENEPFNTIEWAYGYKLTNERTDDQKCEYKTFKEVLEDIFK